MLNKYLAPLKVPKQKNRGINGVKYIERNEFWADTQILKSKVPILVKDPNTGKEGIDYEIHEFEAKINYINVINASKPLTTTIQC